LIVTPAVALGLGLVGGANGAFFLANLVCNGGLKTISSGMMLQQLCEKCLFAGWFQM